MRVRETEPQRQVEVLVTRSVMISLFLCFNEITGFFYFSTDLAVEGE